MAFFLILVVVCIILAANIYLCTVFQETAEMKGHTSHKYFWICFFFGPVGYILVAALPDITVRTVKFDSSIRLWESQKSQPAQSSNALPKL